MDLTLTRVVSEDELDTCAPLEGRVYCHHLVAIFEHHLQGVGFWFWVLGFGRRVQVLGSRVHGSGFRV